MPHARSASSRPRLSAGSGDRHRADARRDPHHRGDAPSSTPSRSMQAARTRAGSRSRWRRRTRPFVPRVIGVPCGSTVTFPNDDPIFHNVFSLSPPQPFDLGLYRAGASKDAHVHPAGGLQRLLQHPPADGGVPRRRAVTLGDDDRADGSWRLDVPPGRYRVTALSERAVARVRSRSLSRADALRAPEITSTNRRSCRRLTSTSSASHTRPAAYTDK